MNKYQSHPMDKVFVYVENAIEALHQNRTKAALFMLMSARKHIAEETLRQTTTEPGCEHYENIVAVIEAMEADPDILDKYRF